MTPELARRLSIAEQYEWFHRATSRRALWRGGMRAAATEPALAAPSTGRAIAGPAPRRTRGELIRAESPAGDAVPPFGRHLAYGADPTTQMSVAWQVPARVTHPFIRIGTSPVDLGQRISAEVRALTTPIGAVSPIDSLSVVAPRVFEQYYVHAAVTGLQPGRTYYYTVGHQGWEFSGQDTSLGSFTTAHSGRVPFTFTAFGDQGVSYDAIGTANLIRAQSPAFHLHAGDVSYAESGGGGLVTDSYDPTVWDAYFTEIESAAGSVPWQVAVGNHEMESWYSPDGYGGQYARFDFPGAATSSTPPTYYSFNYGNVGIVSLDANDVSYEIPANFGHSGGAQVAWLGSTLAAMRANPNVDFIVAYFHHCAYSTCTAHGREGGVEQFFVPLFDKYQIDLVINGHNHIYERTDPLRDGTVSLPDGAPIGSTVRPAADGTTYICAGGAGKSLYRFPAADSYAGNVDNIRPISTSVNTTSGGAVTETVTWSRVRYTGYCLLVIESRPGWRPGATSTLIVRVLSEHGTELDQICLVR